MESKGLLTEIPTRTELRKIRISAAKICPYTDIKTKRCTIYGNKNIFEKRKNNQQTNRVLAYHTNDIYVQTVPIINKVLSQSIQH